MKRLFNTVLLSCAMLAGCDNPKTGGNPDAKNKPTVDKKDDQKAVEPAPDAKPGPAKNEATPKNPEVSPSKVEAA